MSTTNPDNAQGSPVLDPGRQMAPWSTEGLRIDPGASWMPRVRFRVLTDRKLTGRDRGHFLTWVDGEPPREVRQDAMEGVEAGFVHNEMKVGEETWQWVLVAERLEIPKEIQAGVLKCSGCGMPTVTGYCSECQAKDRGTWD